MYVHIELIFLFFYFPTVIYCIILTCFILYTLSMIYSGIFIYVFEIVNEKKIFIQINFIILLINTYTYVYT